MNRTAALRTGTAGPPISAPRGHAFGSTITPAPAPSASASANVNASKANNDTQAARDARAMPPPAFRNTKPQTAHAAHTYISRPITVLSSTTADNARPAPAHGVMQAGEEGKGKGKEGGMGKGGEEAGKLRRSSTVVGVRSLGAPSIVRLISHFPSPLTVNGAQDCSEELAEGVSTVHLAKWQY